MDQFIELFLERAPIIYLWCFYTDGHKVKSDNAIMFGYMDVRLEYPWNMNI